MIDAELERFINEIPKAELHVHIEGTFEPELMFEIAKRNELPTRFSSAEDVREAYEFNNLQEFLDIYYEGAGVLLHEQDFYDLTWNYLQKLHAQNCLHAEIFFDPQTHTDRNVAFSTVMAGIGRALTDGREKLGLSLELIMCFLRHLSEESAIETLERAQPFRDQILGVGLDSSEVGNPPSKFKNVFASAREQGYRIVAHAGEEGPAEYIWEALNILEIERLDHGNRCMDDPQLVERLAREQIALTLCPLSNLKLCVVKELADHPLKEMLAANLLATIHSDDPAYFGGQLNANYIETASALNLSRADIATLARNSFQASFLPVEAKENFIAKVDEFCS